MVTASAPRRRGSGAALAHCALALRALTLALALLLLPHPASAQTSPSVTPTAALTATKTGTPSPTGTPTTTSTPSGTRTSSATPSPTSTATRTPSATGTATRSPTVTQTRTNTPGLGDKFTGFTYPAFLTTAAGSGTASTVAAPAGVAATSAAMSPWGMWLDVVNQRLYYSQQGYHNVKYLDLDDQRVYDYAGSGAAGAVDGPLTSATFNSPRGLDGDPATGDVFVAEVNACLRRILANGTVVRWAGVCGSAGDDVSGMTFPASRAKVGALNAVLFLSDTQQLVADNSYHRVRLVLVSVGEGGVEGGGG